MEFNHLTALSPLDGRYFTKCESLSPLLSEYGLMRFRVQVEIDWLLTLCADQNITELKPLNSQQQQQLKNLLDNFDSQAAHAIKQHEKQCNHDVKAIEYYLRDKLTQLNLTTLIPFIHFACTSEDINNLAYALMVKATNETIILPALKNIITALDDLAKQYAKLGMLSRTHGQSASPTTLGKEIKNFVVRLQRQYKQLKQYQFTGKFNGAVGNYNAHLVAYPKIDWLKLTTSFIQQLGLQANCYTTQIEPHDNLVEYLQILQRVNTIGIDLNRDCWAYIAVGYFQQRHQANEVGSSTMPHKINPIDFENAEGNCGIANALISHVSLKLPISRWQRDLTDSTVLRNLGVIFGHSLLAFTSMQKGIGKLIANEARITEDLQSHWEVLAEAVQTVMRRHGIADAYEQLKAFTRGEIITQQSLTAFINGLKLPDTVKKDLLALTPQQYLGIAAGLANKDTTHEF